MKTSGEGRTPGARDSISDGFSGKINCVTILSLSLSLSWLFLFYAVTHVRIIDSRMHAAIVALSPLGDERGARAKDDETK